MPTLTLRDLDADRVTRLRLRAEAHGRSAEAEHREILRAALASPRAASTRAEVAARLAVFRRRVAGRGAPSAAALLDESRAGRAADLPGSAAEG